VLAPPRAVLLPRGAFDAYVRDGFARHGQFKFRHLYPSPEAFRKTEGLKTIADSLRGDDHPDGSRDPR
jgi:hypothetical protein